jgi:IS5 family transposase
MNRLPPADGDAWHLPRHAHVVVYDQRERELLTIYDCGAAQKPPSAQLLGNLVRVKADGETLHTPTGYTVSLREPSLLRRQGEGHYVIEPA